MQPIIQRTITITITETWTITWPDGATTVWHETHEAAWPAVAKPDECLPPLTDEAARLDPATTEPPIEDV